MRLRCPIVRAGAFATFVVLVSALPLGAQRRATLRPLVIPDGEPRMTCRDAEQSDSVRHRRPVVARIFTFGGTPADADGPGAISDERTVSLVADSAGRIVLLTDEWQGGARGAEVAIVGRTRDSLVGVRQRVHVDTAAMRAAAAAGDPNALRAAVREGPRDTLARPALDSGLALGAWLFARRCGR